MSRLFGWAIGLLVGNLITTTAGMVLAQMAGNPEVSPWPGGVAIMAACGLSAILIAAVVQWPANRWLRRSQ